MEGMQMKPDALNDGRKSRRLVIPQLVLHGVWVSA